MTLRPATYDRYAVERKRPLRDLIVRLSGLSTQALAETFAGAEIIGLDSSAWLRGR